ncbi:MAG: hypothetical protein DIZ80_15180 [endosymbiont of Galathealinum brachiosum]|uniref:Uncharacterized protein n=1 Tax=endosymbiont of Galathealinum brachiosum TaxID=2200906 RepID=A0A370D956_9GAMM|nr:MAG: hypothetical protein DIZ80_15180 [endosymbiont of Galathealinum brachiosum]
MDVTGPAGNASQAISISPPPETSEVQSASSTDVPESEADQEVASTQRIDPDSNVGNNVDTTA